MPEAGEKKEIEKQKKLPVPLKRLDFLAIWMKYLRDSGNHCLGGTHSWEI